MNGTSMNSVTLRDPVFVGSVTISANPINKVTITAPATGATLTIVDGKTFTVNKTITLEGTDGTTITLPATSTTVKGLGDATTDWIHSPNISSLDKITVAATAVLTRTALGNIDLVITATGADTNRIFCRVPTKKTTAGKGWKLTTVRAYYALTVADATSVDLLVQSVAYVSGVAPAVTAAHGGAIVDGDYDADNNTAAKRADKDALAGGEHVMTLTLNTPAFFNTANGNVNVEFTAVLANTGVLTFHGFAFGYTEVEA